MDKPDIITHHFQKACDIYINDSQPVGFQRQKLLLRLFFIRNAVVLCNSSLRALLCCGRGTEEVECPVRCETPSASPHTAGKVWHIHRSTLTLWLVISKSCCHLRRNTKQNTFWH
jgi:hypothetical protein